MQKRYTAGNVYGTAADKAAAHRSGSSASLGQGISSEGANGSNPAYTIHYTRPVASHSEGINSYIQHDPPVLQEVFLLTVFQMVNGSADGYNAPELAYEISAIKAVSTGTVYTTAAYDNDNSVSKKLMKNDNERSPAADNCDLCVAFQLSSGPRVASLLGDDQQVNYSATPPPPPPPRWGPSTTSRTARP